MVICVMSMKGMNQDGLDMRLPPGVQAWKASGINIQADPSGMGPSNMPGRTDTRLMAETTRTWSPISGGALSSRSS